MNRIVYAFFCLLFIIPALADGVTNPTNNASNLTQGIIPSARIPAPKVIVLTRDLSAATGSVAYAGCGFSPRLIIATGGINGVSNYITFSGMAASAGGSGFVGAFGGNTQANVSSQFLNFIDVTSANGQLATVSSFDSDGFTLSWVKTGAPTGTVTIYVACILG